MQKAKHWQIFIPAVNEYPLEKAKSWSYKTYAQSKAQVDKKRVKDIKTRMPLKTAHYAIEMTFGKWRLMGPSGDNDKSPMDMVLDLLKPVIIPDKWKEFKKQFKKKLLQQFEIIGWFKYATDRIDKVNTRINQLISEFVNRDVSVSLNFVPHPDTGESFYSERLVELRSKIVEHFTGQALGPGISSSIPNGETHESSASGSQSESPRTGSFGTAPLQMDMYLDFKITKE